jgi:peptide/nickel transport system ATP-binding protein
VAEMADDIAVMYAGRIVEHADTDTIFAGPEHPYTWGLLSSIPKLDSRRDEELVPIAGRPPSLINLPGGCSFHPRCPYVQPDHMKIDPALEPLPDNARHKVACLLPSETRKRLWRELREGTAPVEARADVMKDAPPAEAVEALDETEGRAAGTTTVEES